MRMCCHPIPPREWRRWLGNCRHSQISLEEKAQTRFDIRLSFYMTFCRQTLAPSESSGAMQLLSPQLALSEAEGTRACVWKSLLAVIRVDHGHRAQRATLVLKQKFPLSSNLCYDDRFDWIHEMKWNHWSTLNHIMHEKLRGPTLSFCVL